MWYLRYARDFWWSPNEKKEAHDDQNGFCGGSNRHITAAAKSSWFPISLGQGLDSFCLMKIQSHTILDMEAIYFHFQHLKNKKKKTGKSNLKSTNRTKRVFSCQWIRENEIPNWFRLLVFCGENESALLSWILCRWRNGVLFLNHIPRHFDL